MRSLGAVAYDEGLAERVRTVLGPEPGVTERRMFGGLCFLLDGNMCAGVVGDDLMARTGHDGFADALARPHAREMDFTGRPSRSMVFVDAEGVAEDDDLARWVALGVEVARALPPK